MSRVHGGFGIFVTFICMLDDEGLITPGWELSREFHLATRDGLQGKAGQLRALLQGRFSPASCMVAGSLMQSSLFHLGIFPRQDNAMVLLLLHPD